MPTHTLRLHSESVGDPGRYRSVPHLEAALTHNGCQKLPARFSPDALRFVSMRERRQLNLRGIDMRVVEAGEIATGDTAEVLSRRPVDRPCGGRWSC